MKIALIYFGQPRWINNPHCYNTQREKIFSQGEVDVFAHLWEPGKSDYAFSTWSNMHTCPSNKNDIEIFLEKWKPKSIKTEIDPGFSYEEGYKLIADRISMRDFNISLSHLYSLEKAIEVFEEHQQQSGAVYDFVAFMRTDLCVWDFPNLSQIKKGFFYYSSLFHADHFADLCYITDPLYVSGLKVYSKIMNPHAEFLKNIGMPSAEQLKRNSFLSTFNSSVLKQIPILVRVVRDTNDIGRQW